MRDPTRPANRPTDPARDGIYRAIQWLLFLDVVLGAGLAMVGAAVLEADSIAMVGLGLAVVGLVLMVFFRILAAREASRHRAEAAAASARQRLSRAAGSDRPGA
jgi:hypothetical protein